MCIALMLTFVQLSDVPVVNISIYSGAGISRVLYPFFHASWVHLLLNLWTFLCIVFYYRIRALSIIIAYIIAISFPADTLASLGAELSSPTVGISGICFALIADQSYLSANRVRFHLYMLPVLLCGFLFPQVNGWLHLYCYAMGLLFGYHSLVEE